MLMNEIMNIVNIFLGDLPPELTILKYIFALYIGFKFIQLVFSVLSSLFRGGRF